MIAITRRFEFDAAHRLPHHPGKCFNVHGHRYVLEVTVTGVLNDSGMIIDFGDLDGMVKDILKDFDHHYLAGPNDEAAHDIESRGFVVTWLQAVPTAENMAQIFGDRLAYMFQDRATVQSVRLFETPNSWAEWTAD